MNKAIHILHLEDDAADAELVQATLEAADMACRTTVAQTRDQFTEALRKGGYDVILADYTLPAYDGLSALRLAQERCPDIPFIFVSGTMGEDPAIEVLKEGATDYVLKQKLSRLVPAVKRALREAENRRERRRVENVLRESEERFRTLAEKSLVGVYIIQDDLFRYVNPAFAEILGYTTGEIMDILGPVDFLTAEDRDRVLESIRRRTTGETESDHLEFHVHGKDGVIRTVEVFGSHASHQGRPAVLGTLIDVTERKKAEEALRTSRLQLTEAMDLAHIVYWEFEAASRAFVFNDPFYTFCGTTAEQEGGYRMPIDEYAKRFVHPEDVGTFNQLLEEYRYGRDAEILFDFEHRIVRRDGDVRHTLTRTRIIRDTAGSIVRIHGALQDITERKKAEEELDRVSKRSRLLLESAGEGIFGLDSEGKVTFINPVAALWLGYDPEELIGKRSHELIHSRNANGIPYPQEVCPICMTCKDGTIHRATKEVFWKKDGTAFPVEYTSTPIMENKIPVGTVVTFRDVTEREELEKRLGQAQKMEAIGTLAGGIAHDFNNILTPIIAHSEMALDDIPDKSPLKFSLEQVLKAGERARDLVQQILAFSRQKESKQVLLKIEPIVKEVLKLLRASLPATIEIRKDIKTEPWSISADPTQIHQILMNLCTNASHAMTKTGGVLEIRAVNESLDSEAAADIPGLAPGPYLRLSIRDTGYGISQEVMEHIFEPYFTTKEKGEGTGLGLAVVHGIVTSLGGAVAVASEPGKGSAFHVYFPAVEREAPSPIQSSVSLPGGTERILLVDDEKSMIDALKPMLERLGYSVIARTSSIEALEGFQSDPSEFDLVVTDQTMPGLTGAELAKEFLRIKPGIPIILCSGFSELINEEGAKAMGIRGYVGKPIVREEMAATIRSALDNG